MLIELGTFVDKNWLDEQFEWCMMRIKKYGSFRVRFPFSLCNKRKISNQKMMIGQMVLDGNALVIL